ncbi:hypothetical protein [Pararhodobacter zhoushanensis]|uniref:Uncharacterized protein n=1 Tax=Pararhodobacter zhoushanensis TaxID=2479545 RepID=A0ABT3H0U3_9RHOB|nr:hypothetical protein [Pararhodobacter zhoushanensis]MCW1933440.1 hypothetical protein [Pararhodobacter zhoushanensis]
MDRRRAQSLARLAQLAALTRAAELAKLAAVAQSRARLKAALDTVRQTEAPLDPAEAIADPAMIGARLAHRRWSEVQQRRLNQQLALVSADWLRQKPAAARAFGRAAVLEELSQKAHTDLHNDKERKT